MRQADTRTDFVFDLSGVLLDWDPLPLYTEFFAGDGVAAQSFLDTVMDDEAQRAISAGAALETVLARQRERHPAHCAAIELWRTHWHEMLRGENEGAVSVLGELRERSYRTFALGNWSREEFELVRPRYAWLEGFDGVLLSGDCGVLKPDARIYRLAQQRFGLDPAWTVFIDDREANARAAVEQGWNGLVFDNARQLYLVLMDYGYL